VGKPPGWFFGFKLHLIFNDRGELLNVVLTPGTVDDRKPVTKAAGDRRPDHNFAFILREEQFPQRTIDHS